MPTAFVHIQGLGHRWVIALPPTPLRKRNACIRRLALDTFNASSAHSRIEINPRYNVYIRFCFGIIYDQHYRSPAVFYIHSACTHRRP